MQRESQLSDDQVEEICKLRANARTRSSEISIARQCAEDMLEEQFAAMEADRMSPQEKLQLLDIGQPPLPLLPKPSSPLKLCRLDKALQRWISAVWQVLHKTVQSLNPKL